MNQIIFIAGFSRSDSTLIESILASVPGICAVGESRYIWTRGFLQNQLCGCGAAFRDCEFWTAVLRSAFGRVTEDDAAHLEQCFRTIHSRKTMPALIFPLLRIPHYRDALATWIQATRALHAGIREVSGASTILDSSKIFSYGRLISEALPEYSMTWLHIVRDARAVAYSRSVTKARPEIYWKKSSMVVTPVWKSAIQWLAYNVAAELLYEGNYLRMRYEDFSRRPEKMSRWLGEQLGLPVRLHVYGEMFQPVTFHSVSGNPSRFTTGTVSVREDSRWHERMPPEDRRLVSLLAFPGLVRYGYQWGTQ